MFSSLGINIIKSKNNPKAIILSDFYKEANWKCVFQSFFKQDIINFFNDMGYNNKEILSYFSSEKFACPSGKLSDYLKKIDLAGLNINQALNKALEGDMQEKDGIPMIDKGLLHLSASGIQSLDDIRNIVITEYCDNNIDGCEPGTDKMPACDGSTDKAFFDSIPVKCDVKVSGYSLRFLLNLIFEYWCC